MSYRTSLSVLWLIATTLCLSALVGCATMDVGSDYDRAATFTQFHTFTIMRRQHNDVQNPLVVTRAEDAIREELVRRGYQETNNPQSADFSVDFTIGSKERTDVNAYPDPYVGAGWGWGRRGWWGGGYWGDTLDVRQYREGTLSIDVFDARTHRPVWHGWAKKELNRSDIEHSEAPIRKAVNAVLAKFPPSGGGAAG
jgi:hypothetical protein